MINLPNGHVARIGILSEAERVTAVYSVNVDDTLPPSLVVPYLTHRKVGLQNGRAIRTSCSTGFASDR